MAETRLRLSSIDGIDEAWERSAPFLLSAIRMGDEYEPEHVLKAIRAGEMQLAEFDSHNAYLAMVTDGITNANGKKTMRIIFAGGYGLNAVLPDGMRMIQEAAKRSGCNSIELIGRDGWLKKLADYGFRKKAIWMECDL